MEENKIFQGVLIGWLIGLPFLIIIFIMRTDYRINLLLININYFKDSDQIVNHLTYLLRLITLQCNQYFQFIEKINGSIYNKN